MISCTDFILSYSELFSYLDSHYGRQEVDRYWESIFTPDGNNNPLILFVQKEGIRGCMSYWSGTLNEEAADFTLYLNEKAGWFLLAMHNCPSKGRLLKFADTLGIKPFRDYCLHCDHYRAAIEKVGLNYTYNFVGMDKASCSILITDPKVFNGRVIVDENTEVLDRRASDNAYFHLDFHRGTNQAVNYMVRNHGIEALIDYLTTYTKNVYANLIEQVKIKGLTPIFWMIKETYDKEKAPEALDLTLSDEELLVEVGFCPAVRYYHSAGIPVAPGYEYTTSVVMQTIAQETGYQFEMMYYDEETGAARYRFYR